MTLDVYGPVPGGRRPHPRVGPRSIARYLEDARDTSGRDPV